MSTRWYPRYIKGNPQLRVFLPNFWMKMIKPNLPCPANHVHFIVSMEMTKFDVKNYLEKIYKVPVVGVRTHVFTGDYLKTPQGYLVKKDDYKVAYILLPKDVSFVFPELFPPVDKQKDELKKQQEMVKNKQEELLEKNKDRGDVPSWFGI